jgi:hypothetical protein
MSSSGGAQTAMRLVGSVNGREVNGIIENKRFTILLRVFDQS